MKFCSECASPVEWLIPEGDHLPRHVCTSCAQIFYSNPRIISGCIPIYEDKVLLCRRNIEPRFGFWTLPAGFLENGETTEQGALRETWEEARATVEIQSLYTMTSLIHVNQVQIFYLASMKEPIFEATAESSEVRLFGESEIPWDELSFSTVRCSLEHFFADRRKAQGYPLYRCSMDRHNPEQNQTIVQRLLV